MSDNPLDLPATPRRLRAAARAAGVSERGLERGLEIATATPDADGWRRFLFSALALLGSALLLAGVGCFVAYNWTRVGRFGKFALIEAAIVAATIVGWWKLPRLPGQLGLAGAAVLVGPLLAVYGQTYQTGADQYGLFVTWFAVIIPWVVVARLSALWVFALALLDVALILFWQQVMGMHDLSDGVRLSLGVAAAHAIAIAAWEWQFHRPVPWLDEQWAPRAVAVTGFTALWIAASLGVVGDREAGPEGLAALVTLGVAVAGAFHYYRRVRRDRFMLTVAIGTGMALVAVAVGRVVFDALKLEILGFFLMAAFVIGEITLGISWFRGSGPDTATES